RHARAEAQRFRAEPANGPRRHLHHPDAALVETQLGVKRPVIQAQRAHCPLDGLAHAPLRRGALSRRRYINRLFKERPFQRIWLVEYREDASRAAADDRSEEHTSELQ